MAQCINPSFLLSIFPTASLLPVHTPAMLLMPLQMTPAAPQVSFLTGCLVNPTMLREISPFPDVSPKYPAHSISWCGCCSLPFCVGGLFSL